MVDQRSQDNLQVPEVVDRHDDLFPLEVTAFERFLINEQTAANPMSIVAELNFNGQLQKAALATALARALTRHPLLCSKLVGRGKRLAWQYDQSLKPSILDYSAAAAQGFHVPTSFNLREEAGLRLAQRQDGPGNSSLCFVAHHACCDGVGLRQFLAEVLWHYANTTSHEPIQPLRPTLLNELKRRGQFQFKRPPTIKLTTWERLRNAYCFHFCKPRPLLGTPVADVRQLKETRSWSGLKHVKLTADTSSKILDFTRAAGVSLNTLAIALLFSRCATWNQQRGFNHPNSRLRLLVPYDLRSSKDLKMSATNRLSFAFLGRTYRQCESQKNLINSVAEEMANVKESRLPMDFLAGLGAVAAYPQLLGWVSSISQNMATAVLTYTGDVGRGLGSTFPRIGNTLQIGDVQLSSVLAAPPTRINTNLAVAICVNWGHINFSANWNPAAISAAEVDSFLEGYADLWRQLVQAE